MASEGDFSGALGRLNELEKRLHPSVRSLHALTRGRVLDMLGRLEEAEAEVIRAAKLDPANMRAHLDLAAMSGRRFHFKNARLRLLKLAETAEPEIQNEATALLSRIDAISSGKAAKRLAQRAREMARYPMGPAGEPPGLPARFDLIEHWIQNDADAASEKAEDIAVLIGETLVSRGGSWKLSLALDHSVVVLTDGREINPFEVVEQGFLSGNISIVQGVTSKEK